VASDLGFLGRILLTVAPSVALNRAKARTAHAALMRYNAASVGDRTRSLRPVRGDADTMTRQRGTLAAIARDMVRNTPFAARAQQVIASNVVGDGIIPKAIGGTAAARKKVLRLIEAHLDTTDIDANGRQNLYGLQRLAMNTIVDAGEVLIRRRWRTMADGLAVPFQIEVLEPEYLDCSQDGVTVDGNIIRDGIQYDRIGRRQGYWLYNEHPQATSWTSLRNMQSRFVPASEVLHVFRQDRPGQSRGVSWLAIAALVLQDLDDYQDAQIMRQKIAACFAAFRVSPEEDQVAPGYTAADPAGLADSLIPGRIQNLGPGEDIRFAEPPGVTGYDEFTANHIRMAAASLGITYEALSFDLSRINFSSARMGRIEMDRNISGWQWQMLIPLMMQPIGGWMMEAVDLMQMSGKTGVTLGWVPPARVIVDPTREIPAMLEAIEGGLASRQDTVRSLGKDPERLLEEQAQDKADADRLGLRFGKAATTPQPPVAAMDSFPANPIDQKETP
jgi:lambda family phage portal protein